MRSTQLSYFPFTITATLANAIKNTLNMASLYNPTTMSCSDDITGLVYLASLARNEEVTMKPKPEAANLTGLMQKSKVQVIQRNSVKPLQHLVSSTCPPAEIADKETPKNLSAPHAVSVVKADSAHRHRMSSNQVMHENFRDSGDSIFSARDSMLSAIRDSALHVIEEDATDDDDNTTKVDEIHETAEESEDRLKKLIDFMNIGAEPRVRSESEQVEMGFVNFGAESIPRVRSSSQPSSERPTNSIRIMMPRCSQGHTDLHPPELKGAYSGVSARTKRDHQIRSLSETQIRNSNSRRMFAGEPDSGRLSHRLDSISENLSGATMIAQAEALARAAKLQEFNSFETSFPDYDSEDNSPVEEVDIRDSDEIVRETWLL